MLHHSRSIVPLLVLGVALTRSIATADTIDRTGPVRQIPNPHVVVTLTCYSSGNSPNAVLNVKNSLNMTISAGQTVHWSYRRIDLTNTALSKWLSGDTVLSAPLAPGNSTVVAQAGANAAVARCRATATL